MDLSQLNQDQLSQLLSLVNLVQPPPAASQPSSSTSPSTASDVNRLASEQFGRLQALVNNMQPAPNHAQVQASQTQPNPSSPSSWMPNSREGQMLLPQQPTSAQPSPLSAANSPIGLYQNIRTTQNLPSAPQGHPSTTSMLSNAAGPSSQPFLGFGNLGLNMRSAVNQRRMSSARNSTAVVRRRTARGPAVAPPALPFNTSPKITDCLEDNIDSNGVSSQLLRLKVKVYPPLV